MDKVDDNNNGGGAGDGGESEKQSTITSDDKTSKTEGDTLDEYGYEKVSSDDTKTTDDKKPVDDKDLDKKPDEKSGSGYGDESKTDDKNLNKKTDDKTIDDKKTDDKTTDDKTEHDVKLDFQGFSEEQSAPIKDFIKKNKVPQHIAEAIVQARKTELDQHVVNAEQAKVNREKAKTERHETWKTEIKNDKDFGGDRFEKTYKNVDKLLTDFLPRIKKNLTDQGEMLSPDSMRDFAKLAERLYSSENLKTGGQHIENSSKEEETDDSLDFYSQ